MSEKQIPLKLLPKLMFVRKRSIKADWKAGVMTDAEMKARHNELDRLWALVEALGNDEEALASFMEYKL